MGKHIEKPNGIIWGKGGKWALYPSAAAGMTRTIEGMMATARAFLKLQGITEQDTAYTTLRDSLNVNRYQAAVSRALRTHNKPEAGLAPHPHGSGDKEGLAIYRGKLDLYGAVLILTRAPALKDALATVKPVHIGEACDIAEQYALLFLARFVINVDSLGARQLDAGRGAGPRESKRLAKIRKKRLLDEIRNLLLDRASCLAFPTVEKKSAMLYSVQSTWPKPYQPYSKATIADFIREVTAELEREARERLK